MYSDKLVAAIKVSGRILRGHTYIPGPTEGNNTDGKPSGAYKSAIAAAFTDFLAVPDTFPLVWSRTHGTVGPVLSGSCWDQWAVLRSRRD